MRRMGLGLVVLAAAALAVVGLSSAAPASVAVHQVSRANAAVQQVPHTKAAWHKAMRNVRTPGRGCFRASYPALAWHAVKCVTVPLVPSAAAQPARSARHVEPAQVGGANGDYVAQVPGLISEATGTFSDVSSGISETGLVQNTGSPVKDAFSLQLNSQLNFTTAACSASSNSACTGWQQFLYTYGTDNPTVYMQYWLFDYGATSSPSTCPANWKYSPSTNGSQAGCYINSRGTPVPTVTASELGSVSLAGSAVSGGNDEVSLTIGSEEYAETASDSVLDLAAVWDQTQWGVYGDENSAEADFTAPASLEAQTTIEVSSGPSTVSCDPGDFTNETNNLYPASTSNPGVGEYSTIASEQTTDDTDADNGTETCAAENAAEPSPAYDLATDALTGTWATQSDLDSDGALPTTTADCGNWSGSDGTQVVGLSNGDDLWSFGDTILGAAVTRQDFFNNGSIHNSMVLQDGSAFTTITGGNGCASGEPYTATTPITSADGRTLWPASSILYGSDVEKFYYSVNSDLVQQTPEVAEIAQADLESGDTYSAQAEDLDGCTANPIMWGAATVSSGGYTYIYGSQQYSSTGGDTDGEGGELYLARSAGDPSEQGSWEYYTTSGWSSAGAACDGLTLEALGGSEPIEVPTEFSVTIVNGDFWLVDQDPANGDQPGWAVAHEALTPTGFSNDPAATVDLFDPTVTTFPGIDDSPPGLVHYAVRMLDPLAVTASSSGDVVIAYNVNDSSLDEGCIPLVDYDANVYRPRFIDVPASDLFTELNDPGSSALRKLARTTASPATSGKPATATAAADGRAARLGPGTEPPAPVIFSPQVAARGEAQLKAASRAGSLAAVSTSSSGWTMGPYLPDSVPNATTWSAAAPGAPTWSWSSTCPANYAAVDGNITIEQNSDGSVTVSWPNRGPDVWYWFHWQDDTSDPGTWNTNEFWQEGPNADGYLPAGAAGNTNAMIYQTFTLPTGTDPGDEFSFWVQAFAAGNGSVISPDSSATAVSVTPTSPTETVAGLTATAGTDAVTLNWAAAPTPAPGQSIWYSVRYKTLSQSTWTYTTDYISNTADMTPLAGGTEYEFEVAVTDAETNLATATWSAPVYATPQT